MMKQLLRTQRLSMDDDANTLGYWLNWNVLLCALWVFASAIFAVFMLYKYKLEDMHDADAWKPCLKQIHPIWLMVLRIIAFCLILVALIFDAAVHGAELYLYYTQWTFTLVTIYFAFGSWLSIHGCYKHIRANIYSDLLGMDEEQGSYVPLPSGANMKDVKPAAYSHNQPKYCDPESASFSTCLFQVLFQVSGGAVMLTDIVYWGVCFPFMNIRDYEMGILTVVAHSLNAVLLLGDTALNSLKFPWFGISYFFLWTSVYVVFQWILHACLLIWWPYPFLDLSAPYAPLWYFLVGLLHIPCYGIFALLVKAKQCLLIRWFAHSSNIGYASSHSSEPHLSF